MPRRTTTRTTGPLHFEDLSPTRFEDMCLQYFYPMKEWTKIEHWGRKGKDRGVDIAAEFLEGDDPRRWAIQCKRYKSITARQLTNIVDDYLAKNQESIADCYWLVLACDLSRQESDVFQTYCRKSGMRDVKIVTSSILEAELYARHPGILYAFFGISSSNARIQTMTKIKRRLAMKRQIEREFLSIPRKGLGVIVHDVHRDNYPNPDTGQAGIPPWFKLDYWGTYHCGLSFCLQGVHVIVATDGSWRITTRSNAVPAGWIEISAIEIGNIPYDNIVAIDPSSDEYTRGVHLYCEFANGGTPFEKIWHDPVERDKDRVMRLSEESRVR